ncbi:hypothetical protein Y032_0266g711 [Ancylostoma ceylanicum]|uniref:Uncharacterized protein n=1 Tax=Ancylostoma ceylanicum TaxID=53326 RepID=A0A016SA57_9BILA|nr:hypothetical protein Y032_0266g711 [Ancylostoma ceylanicum]
MQEPFYSVAKTIPQRGDAKSNLSGTSADEMYFSESQLFYRKRAKKPTKEVSADENVSNGMWIKCQISFTIVCRKDRSLSGTAEEPKTKTSNDISVLHRSVRQCS